MRVNVNLDEELIKEIDKRAKTLHLSRSAYISMSCANYNRLHDKMIEMSEELDERLKKSKQTSDTLKELLNKNKN